MKMLCVVLWWLSFPAFADEPVDAQSANQTSTSDCSCDDLRAELRKKEKQILWWKQEAAYQRYRGDNGQRLYEGLRTIFPKDRILSEDPKNTEVKK